MNRLEMAREPEILPLELLSAKEMDFLRKRFGMIPEDIRMFLERGAEIETNADIDDPPFRAVCLKNLHYGSDRKINVGLAEGQKEGANLNGDIVLFIPVEGGFFWFVGDGVSSVGEPWEKLKPILQHYGCEDNPSALIPQIILDRPEMIRKILFGNDYRCSEDPEHKNSRELVLSGPDEFFRALNRELFQIYQEFNPDINKKEFDDPKIVKAWQLPAIIGSSGFMINGLNTISSIGDGVVRRVDYLNNVESFNYASHNKEIDKLTLRKLQEIMFKHSRVKTVSEAKQHPDFKAWLEKSYEKKEKRVPTVNGRGLALKMAVSVSMYDYADKGLVIGTDGISLGDYIIKALNSAYSDDIDLANVFTQGLLLMGGARDVDMLTGAMTIRKSLQRRAYDDKKPIQEKPKDDIGCLVIENSDCDNAGFSVEDELAETVSPYLKTWQRIVWMLFNMKWSESDIISLLTSEQKSGGYISLVKNNRKLDFISSLYLMINDFSMSLRFFNRKRDQYNLWQFIDDIALKHLSEFHNYDFRMKKLMSYLPQWCQKALVYSDLGLEDEQILKLLELDVDFSILIQELKLDKRELLLTWINNLRNSDWLLEAFEKLADFEMFVDSDMPGDYNVFADSDMFDEKRLEKDILPEQKLSFLLEIGMPISIWTVLVENSNPAARLIKKSCLFFGRHISITRDINSLKKEALQYLDYLNNLGIFNSRDDLYGMLVRQSDKLFGHLWLDRVLAFMIYHDDIDEW